VRLRLIESNHKKVAFLREVVRTLGLSGVEVFAGRAEEFGEKAELVTLRAVEKFEAVLPVAANLVAKGGRLGLLIGAGRVERARELLPRFQWEEAVAVPGSQARVVLMGIVK
jgi:16S rRNA (guanine527-N7)-methyltransferase